LHGLRSDEAREALGGFIRQAHRQGWRCVRVVHGKGLGFAMYTAESTETCGGYPASKGYEVVDGESAAEAFVGALRAQLCSPGQSS
jgi:hypothetical protein